MRGRRPSPRRRRGESSSQQRSSFRYWWMPNPVAVRKIRARWNSDEWSSRATASSVQGSAGRSVRIASRSDQAVVHRACRRAALPHPSRGSRRSPHASPPDTIVSSTKSGRAACRSAAGAPRCAGRDGRPGARAWMNGIGRSAREPLEQARRQSDPDADVAARIVRAALVAPAAVEEHRVVGFASTASPPSGSTTTLVSGKVISAPASEASSPCQTGSAGSQRRRPTRTARPANSSSNIRSRIRRRRRLWYASAHEFRSEGADRCYSSRCGIDHFASQALRCVDNGSSRARSDAEEEQRH